MSQRVQKLGIIGGGQLARMLTHSGQRLGLEVHVLAGEAHEPAAQVTRFFHQGNLNDLATLQTFLGQVDVATFESEFLDTNKVKLASEFAKTPMFPSTLNMSTLQDRKSQKQLLDECKIPTAPWIFVEHEHQALEVFRTLGPDTILKKCRFGYDGYGTFVVKNENDLKTIFSKNFEFGYIAEAKIKFKRELAFMIARDQFSNTLSLPLVESHQQDSKCLWTKGPIHHAGFRKIESQMIKLLKKINYVGCMGVELFDCGDQLLVNELAPRVHNSGHYSMNALVHDQFLLHVIAVTGMKLPKKNQVIAQGFAMHNLIGLDWTPSICGQNLFYHWYGKSETRPGRKMGHLNAIGTSAETALRKLTKLLEKE